MNKVICGTRSRSRMSPSERPLEERIGRGEAAIARKRAAGEPVPPGWEERLAELKALAAQRHEQTPQDPPAAPAPRYAPGCLYGYPPGRRVRPVLRCVAHPGCSREVVLWRPGQLAEMFTLEKLTGAARRDGEAELAARRRAG